MSIIGSNILAGAAGSGVSAYEIEQSLRFAGGSTQYLYRTGAITAQGGVSLWVKFHRDVGSYTAGVYDPIIYLSGGGPWLYRNPYGYLYYRSISSGGDTTWSAQRTRDHSAWYHIFLKFNSSNSTSLYVNNVLWGTQTSSTIGTSNAAQRVGYDGTYFAQCYLAEYHAAFGESLDPTDFGEYNDSGVWVPKEFTGSYGSQGFYLKFDPSAANGLGHDHSGNGNHFTNAGGFTTSGTGTDVMSDTPTTNWCTLNPLEKPGGTAPVYENGNLTLRNSTNYFFAHGVGTFGLNSGKWYFETSGDGSIYVQIGFVDSSQIASMTGGGGVTGANISWHYQSNGIIRGLSSTYQDTGLTAASTAGDIMGLAIDFDAGEASWYVNGTQVGSTVDFSSYLAAGRIWYPVVAVTNEGTDITNVNFGQRDFEYTPPTGFKALNTSNLPAPDIADGSEYFNTVTYTGSVTDTSTQAVTGVGFQSDWTWIKRRDGSNSHQLVDVVRGTGKWLESNNINVENSTNTNGVLTSFDSDGFTLTGGSTNANICCESGNTYVAWNWLAGGSGSSNTAGSITSTVSANPTAGFSIVSYTGNATAGATIGHGLGVAPSMIITKNRGSTSEWAVYHSAIGNTKALLLNRDYNEQTSSLYWNNTSPTNTVFSLGSGSTTNNTNAYVAYCFAEVEGYSKFGSYTGNGSNDGPFVYCGFKPELVIYKRADASGGWWMYDATRSPANGSSLDKYVRANNSAAEDGDGAYSTNEDMDIVSNGFKIRDGGGDVNVSGSNYVFMAWAKNLFGGSGVSPATAR